MFLQKSHLTNDIECGIIADCNYKFILTGQTWRALREYFPDLIDRICVRGAIFARMSSDQKQQLVMELMGLGYYVGTHDRNGNKKAEKYI